MNTSENGQSEACPSYIEREVLPHVPDAWVDRTKTKVREARHEVCAVLGLIPSADRLAHLTGI